MIDSDHDQPSRTPASGDRVPSRVEEEMIEDGRLGCLIPISLLAITLLAVVIAAIVDGLFGG